MRRDAGEISDKNDWVDGHVEDAGSEREPSLLKSPEAAQGATDPAVVAPLFGKSGGQFTDHERGGQTPDEWNDEQQEKCAAVAGVADNVFEAVGTSGDHEIRRSNKREQSHFVVGPAHAPGLP